MTEHEKVLRAINVIVSSGLGLDLEMWETSDSPQFSEKLLTQAARAFGEIYKMTHSTLSSCTTHDDWKLIADQILEAEAEKHQ